MPWLRSDKADDGERSLASYFALARTRGLQIGLIVDEAHIALHLATEFGRFVRWLGADYLLMASATPKDTQLNDFIASAGNIAFKAFSVSRADVVAERLRMWSGITPRLAPRSWDARLGARRAV